jgi:hypothetical protein
MLNDQLNEFSNATSLLQVASYFDTVAAAVKIGDTNKRYALSENASTAPSCPVSEGSFTTVTISPTSDNMCDLANSYITAILDLSVSLNAALGSVSADITNAANGGHNRAIWVGYKDSMDAIESYQIMANGSVIYTQNNAIEESYITACAATEEVKKADVFSKVRHVDVWKRVDTRRSGCIFEIIPGGTLVSAVGTISIKIDLRRFLPLSSIKYLPEFAGNIQLRIKFSTAGLVYCPVGIQDFLGKLYNAGKYLPITNRFVPFGDALTMANSAANADGAFVTVSTIKMNKTNFRVTECASHLWNFGISADIYQSLVQRYSSTPLSFPVQTLSFNVMNGSCNKNGKLSLTVTPRFIDTIFMLFQKDVEYKTVYENPRLSGFQLLMGGFGSVPQQEMSSIGPVLYEMVANALNFNNDMTGLNRDVMRSLTSLEDTRSTNVLYGIGVESNDVTNFLIAIPTSLDFTYQQGQTSATPITYSANIKFTEETGWTAASLNSIPLMGFLKDSVLAIQVNPNGPPIVQLDEFDITSPDN